MSGVLPQVVLGPIPEVERRLELAPTVRQILARCGSEPAGHPLGGVSERLCGLLTFCEPAVAGTST